MTYAIHSIFRTLQGEGVHAGTAALFVRFAGCNVWSGREEDRERDARRGVCARWCDTNFRGVEGTEGGYYTLHDLLDTVDTLRDRVPIVVLTGGEPSLQVDRRLVKGLQATGLRVHVETNGSRPLPSECDWITLSPKPPMTVVTTTRGYNELKCVLPDVDPAGFTHLVPVGRVFVQAQAGKDGRLMHVATNAALLYVLANPETRLSIQTHKVIGVP